MSKPAVAGPEPREFVDELVARLGRAPQTLIPMLQAVQRNYRYLPEAALRRISETTESSAADVMGAATFYSQFRLKPVGEHMISVCHGTACHVKGAPLVTEELRRRLGLPDDEDTDGDGRYTVQKVACVGCCTLAPVLQIDGITYGHMAPDTIMRALTDFESLARQGYGRGARRDVARNSRDLSEIRVIVDSCCIAGGALQVRDALAEAVAASGAPAVVRGISCTGLCHQIPLVEVASNGSSQTYSRVSPDQASQIVQRHFRPRGLAARIRASIASAVDRAVTPDYAPITRYALDVRDPHVCAFVGPQKRIAMESAGTSEPLDLDAYRATGGFTALARAVHEMTPDQVIDEVTTSGIRGRGGAGFPTGRKWSLVRKSIGERKYVICNGDEGDPGAFMDRMLLESFPYRVIEGIAIAAVAIGAEEAVFYVRAEYPHAVARLTEALKRCTDAGILGPDALGPGKPLRMRIVEGAGAFVCGEETALIASLEGRRGIPSLRPPYPAQSGLFGAPTLINNVETYAAISWIIRNGGAAYAEMGTERSKGTKVFALAGKVQRGGLIEVPMGVTLRQIVYEIGGGPLEGRTIKAVQVGGPSGGCVPVELADIPVDYDALVSVGAIMGSGGLVVLDDQSCMVDIARYFLEFTQHESCGKCTMCRVGTKRLLEMLDRICSGAGRAGDIDKLEELATEVRLGSLCGLGQTAPNPVLSTIRHFRSEYEAHLKGVCPAGVCRKLIRYEIDRKCIGCTKCAQECPVNAIPVTPFAVHTINQELCTQCDACRRVCPEDAVSVVPRPRR